METKYVTSADGAKIAYCVTGKGPALLLVHGGMSNKSVWKEFEWIERLKEHFTIITPDIRGNGESDMSEDASFFSIDNILNDFNAILEACNVEKFYYMGHSYGATIGFHVVRNNKNVIKAVCAGSTPGEYFSKIFAPEIKAFYDKPNRHKKANTLHLMDITEEDREWVRNTNLDVFIAQMSAWETWPIVQIDELNSNIAIYTGTNDNKALLDYIMGLEESFKAKGIVFKVFEGLDHGELIRKPGVVIPWVRDFLLK